MLELILSLFKVKSRMSVGQLVCRSTCHKFYKGRDVSLPCSYRSTCSSCSLVEFPIVFSKLFVHMSSVQFFKSDLCPIPLYNFSSDKLCVIYLVSFFLFYRCHSMFVQCTFSHQIPNGFWFFMFLFKDIKKNQDQTIIHNNLKFLNTGIFFMNTWPLVTPPPPKMKSPCASKMFFFQVCPFTVSNSF